MIIGAHFQHIDDNRIEIIGLRCCNKCRQLRETTTMLCSKIHTLGDVAISLKYAGSFNRVKPPVSTDVASQLSDNTTDSHDSTVSLIHTAHNISLLDEVEHVELQQTLYFKTQLPNSNNIKYEEKSHLAKFVLHLKRNAAYLIFFSYG